MVGVQSSVKVAVAIVAVFLACCSNVVFLEMMVKEDPGCGNLVTFASFLFVSAVGFVFTARLGTRRPAVPLRAYAVMVAMYFVVTVASNHALSYGVPMPLHMIFRSGSLIANLLMGMALLGRRYSVRKQLSVLAITVGITICTILSSSTKEGSPAEAAVPKEGVPGDDGTPVDQEPSGATFAAGIALLVTALMLSARMGIYQEVIYREHGKHPMEALLYSHLLPLPGFLLIHQDIRQHLLLAAASPPLPLAWMPTVPRMVLYLVCNTASQYVCISAVFVLTTECSSLVVTLVITLRKFASLFFSIWYFRNPFTPLHWLGAALVFSGTLVFSLSNDTDKEPKATVEATAKGPRHVKAE